MHVIHFSHWLSGWFDGMPEAQRALAYKLFYAVGILSVVFLVWRLSRSEQRMESGKVETKWHHPKFWYQRFLAIKEENYKNAPEGAIAFIEGSRKFLAKAYGIFSFLLGALLLVMYVWSGFEFGWVGLIGLLLMVVAYFLVKRPNEF